MDLRTQTSLLASVLCVAITLAVLLRPRKRRVHWLFVTFGATVAAWYITTFLLRLLGGSLLEKLNLICAVLLPVTAVQFFRHFAAEETRSHAMLHRVALGIAAVLIAVAFTPFHRDIVVLSIVFTYVLVVLAGALWMIWRRGRVARSRFDRARLQYLALVGALAATFTTADYLPYVGLDIPPVGTVLTLIFLYVLSQSILRYRLLDLYELAGRLAVLTAVSFALAAIFWLLVYVAGGRFFLHAVVAVLVVLLVVDPVRSKVEEKISQIFFRERYDLERAILDLRRRLAHTLEIEHLTHLLLAELERSRRVTHAAVYLVDEDLRGYDLAGHVGPAPVARLEIGPVRPLLDRLKKEEALVLEALERELEEHRQDGEDREAESVYESIQALEAMHASVCISIRGERDIYGLLCIRDERLRDAFSPEEVQLMRGLAAQAATGIENSRVYQRMKERDRLAALGEMAAGLAHEIRNPLGSIKASAQYLAEPAPEGELQQPREFLDIIVEEVDRLNRVVSSFLDYARPSRGNPAPTDVNAAVRRTMHVLGRELGENVRVSLALADEVPNVRIDVEQLRQVLINLTQNAAQAMDQRGQLTIETAERERQDVYGQPRRWVEIRVADTGPGIPQKVLAHLFVPFVTTKDRGTGLGLAISQRIVTAAGGHIEVRTHEGVGSTFIVRLPTADDSATGPITLPPRPMPPVSSETPALPQGALPRAALDGEREGAAPRGGDGRSEGSASLPDDLDGAVAGDRTSNLATSR